MEEKKLYEKETNGQGNTIAKDINVRSKDDAEIVQGLENWILHNCTAKQEDLTNALDLIHRLQSELKYKTECYDELCNMNNEIAMEMSEQKAEIERLTEEEEYLDGCAKQFLADYQKCEIANTELQELNAKYYNEAKDLRRVNAELQKQVDELKKSGNGVLLTSLYKKQADDNKRAISVQRAYWKKKLQQAVKDTAKEILQSVGDIVDDGDDRFKYKDYQWHKRLCERYGVEVE